MRLTLAAVATALLLVPQGLSQDAKEASVSRIYSEYLSLGETKDVRRLVQLDQDLRKLLPQWQWEGAPMSSRNWRPIWSAMGVSLTLFEPETLSYSGKLLVEAHQRDPNASRSYTLYSTVFSGDGEWSGRPPHVAAAQMYLREFPNGPFAANTHLALANLYADLFKVIRRAEAGQPRDGKYDCVREYITTDPLSEQRLRAQETAVDHYAAVVERLPNVKAVADWLAEMRRGTSTGWHYCPD